MQCNISNNFAVHRTQFPKHFERNGLRVAARGTQPAHFFLGADFFAGFVVFDAFAVFVDFPTFVGFAAFTDFCAPDFGVADFLDEAGFAVPDFLAPDFFTAGCFALDVFFTAFVVFDALTLFFAFGALDAFTAFTAFTAFAFEAFVFCAGAALATRTPAFFRPARRTTLARGTANVNSEGRTLARFADAGESDALTSASSRRSFTCACV